MSQRSSISNTTLLWICYGLYGAALICGGITAIIAVIIGYLKRKDINDALTNSHLSWQIATFWQVAIGMVAVAIVSFLLTITVVLSFLVFPLWFLLAIWYIYRIAKGALALNNGRSI